MERDREAHGNGVLGREKLASGAKIMMMLLVLLAIAPSITALSITVDAPESVTEGELLRVNFTVHNSTANVTEKIYRNDNLVKEGTEFEWKTDRNDSGTYTFKFQANTTNESVEEEKVVEVLDSPTQITIESPPNDVLTDDQIRISVTTNTEMNSCSYEMDNGMNGSLNEDTDEWYKVLLLGTDGVYNLTVQCSNNEDTVTAERMFILDTTAPQITSKKPEGDFAGTPVPLEIKTNENSVCRYSKEDVNYDAMEKEFSQTGGTDHKQIADISEQKDVTYYLACADRHGNQMQDNEELTFFANLKPTASISIEGEDVKEDLLKPGTYEVNVKTSEPVIEPSLTYEFSKDNEEKEVSLEGSGTQWEGFISIGEEVESDVGSFTFSAKDLTDLKGTRITDGKIFLVDTEAPEPVESFKLTQQGIDAKLEWIYEGETVDHFEIYRDKEPKVDRLDKWAETPEKVFVDQNVKLDKKYYYRVAPVDKAGNVGELSNEKSIVVSFNKTENQTGPEVTRKLNETQKRLRSQVMDVENAIQNLESKDGRAELKVINHLNLIEEAKNAKKNIQGIIDEIDKLKLVGINEKDARNRIKVFLDNADKQMSKVAEDVTVVDSTRQEQALIERDTEEAAAQILAGVNLNSQQKRAYKEDMKQLQDKVSVNSEAITARVNYIARPSDKKLTLIHKNVLTDEPLRDAFIVETIPKGIARRVDEITFKQKPETLQPDPIVRWEHRELSNKDIYYHVDKIASLTDARNTRTVVLTKPDINQSANEVTGAVTGSEDEESDDSGGLAQILVFIGGIVALSLTVYYVSVIKENGTHPRHNIMPEQVSHQRRQPQKRKTRRHPRKALKLHRHIKQGHRYADDVRYEEALQVYKQIVDKLEEEHDKKELDRKYREKLQDSVTGLYKKLDMLLNIKRAHHAVDVKDINKLKDVMKEIKKTYHELEGESELAEHVRQSYSYFINHMKGLDREEFFKNLEL